MARKRMIDPSFWIDEKLGTLEPAARLLFMGLISQADDEGRLNGHPSLIKSLIFPYDHDITVQTVEEWLVQLDSTERNLIHRYVVNNQKYILICNFKKHQTINKPQKSKLPPPPDNYGSTTVVVDEQDGNTTAQKKGIEEEKKGREEEEKGKVMNAPFHSNHHQERISELIKQCGITNTNIFQLEQVESFIGVIDLEVIEMVIKKSSGKRLSYVVAALEGTVKDGITKKDQIPKGGQAYAEYGERNERLSSGDSTESASSEGSQPVWKPPAYLENVIPMPKVSG